MDMNVIRTESAACSNMSVPETPADVEELREIYRNIAVKYVEKLRRSVRKQYDPPISCEGYQEEIELQKTLANQVFFAQRCRAAVEQSFKEGSAFVEGDSIAVTFAKQEDGKILVTKSEKK